MRFTAVSLISLVLVMTSTPSQVLRALNKIGLPISITFSLVVAMRTIPRIFEYIDTSVKIQFMRGLGSNAPRVLRVFYMLKGAIYAIVPVIVLLVRGAKDTAISADTRAFRAYPRRTYMRP
ncbi:cobalt transport protein, partial [mine drainage metagenome]